MFKGLTASGPNRYFTFMAQVKNTRGSRISSKHQITLPVRVLHEAGLRAGERLVAHVEGPGRVTLVREGNPIDDFAGRLTGVWEPGELDRLRDEWD